MPDPQSGREGRGGAPDGPATFREVIDRQADERGDAPFLVLPAGDAATTYGVLRARARAVAGRLAGLGVAKGRTLALVLDNGPTLVDALLGALYGGVVAVPLSPESGPAHIGHALQHCRADLVLASPPHADMLRAVGGGRGSPPAVLVPADQGLEAWCAEAPARALTGPGPDDPGVLAYTSGTTGQPRAPLFTHGALVASAANIASAYRLDDRDRALCVRPLSHRGGQNTVLLATLVSGGAVVLPSRFDLVAFWHLMVVDRCTWVSLVPTMVAELSARTAPPAPPGSLAHVRFARSSGAALAADLHQQFESRFGIPLVEALGATEAGSVVFTNPLPPGRRKPGSVGRPAGFEVRIVDDQGEPVPGGAPGEVLVRGPSCMTAYYGDPVATAAVLTPNGWLRTGDRAYQDADGYLFVVGRTGDLINKGGVHVAPREIEEALAGQPSVLEATAIGVPDAYLGEDIVAFVVPRPGEDCRPQMLAAACEGALGAFKSPGRIVVLDALPRLPSGKPDRRELARRAALGSQHVPRPDGGAGASEPAVPPRTPVERLVSEAWAEVLGRPSIGVHDDFFTVGGGSLDAVRILARLARVFPATLSFGAFLEQPTIAQQALLLDGALLAETTRDDAGALALLDQVERLSDDDVMRRLLEQDDAAR